MITSGDRDILRNLADKIRKISESEENCAKREAWYLHDEGRGEKPLLLVPEGYRLAAPEWKPACESELGKNIERQLYDNIIRSEIIGDDLPIEAVVKTNWDVTISDYGVEVKREHHTDSKGGVTGFHWDNPIKDLERDFHKLKPRTCSVNRETTLARQAELAGIFDGIMEVKIRGQHWWTFGLTQTAIYLIGLEELMLYMYDEPEMLHKLMAFLRDDHIAVLEWFEREGLLSLNNSNDAIGSGSIGYTKAFSAEEGKVRAKDIWALLESQETVGVGPEMFDEFIFPYQLEVAEKFGRTYYGCCEPVDNRWHILKRIHNLKRVSVSPWANEKFMAENMGRDYAYSRKPNPTLVSTEKFDEKLIRKDLRGTLEVTKANNCPTEIIMKDVHTLNNKPDRLRRWVEIAREEIDKVYS
ncbi:MAG: hypothetical protein JXR97_01105 [Planctomycetes bacterium]|nr:hypothetical protein [Planctomycetota bacterium]